jgi:hypothetical protein
VASDHRPRHHDRLVRLLGTRAADPRTTAGRASTRWLACSTAGLAADQYVAGYVIEMWKSPRALNIAQYDNGRMKRISKISSEMAQLREETNEALRMKLRGEVDLPTYRTVTRELDAAHDQLAREHKSLTSEAAMPELPDPSLAWEDLSAVDRRALTEMLVDKIIIERHPSKIGKTSATATCRIAAVKKPAPRPITMNATAGWRAMMRSNACCPPVPGPRPAWA